MKKSGLIIYFKSLMRKYGFKTPKVKNPVVIYIINISGVLLLSLQICKAVPSFSRQTGMACAACHNSFPELNSFGRQFKLNGYTLTNIKTIEAATDSGKNKLNLITTPAFAAMVMSSFTNVKKDVSGQQNHNVEFPQQLSLFYSGQITPHIGAFMQITYDPVSGTVGLDNTDVRYSNHCQLGSMDWLYGFNLNNNPTVQDVWNTVPAWRYPYASSSTAPSPVASTLLEGALSQQVAGLGTYGLLNNLLYYEVSFYRSAPQGAVNPPNDSSFNTLYKLAPYWRFALQHQFGDHYLMIGIYGMSAQLFPRGVTGLFDKYIDIGVDLQYEYAFPNANFSLHSSLIHEKRTGGADSIISNLNSFKIDGNLYLQNGLGLTLGYFNTSGDMNMNLYGTNNGKPDTNGTMLEVSFLPWYNTKFAIQYIMYNKFNGQAKNYDGTNRNAIDNNTLYCLAWFSF